MGELEVYYKFILSIALILIVARGAGELAERFLNQPAVLGELLAGIAISPFALGGIIFQGDPILLNFGAIDHAFGIEDFRVMEVFSMIAVIVLLFHAGVETDVHQFMRLGFGGSAIAVGGVVVPFIAGYFVTTMFGYPPAAAIFMGAVLTATSIGITVRILMDMKRFHTKEGTTILVAAVVDDILAVIILALVVAIAVTGEISIAGLVTLGAIGFSVWFAIVMVGVKFHTYVSRILLAPFKKSGTMPIFALVFGLLLAYLMTLVQLHPVIGAYAAGLMFAATKERKEIAHAIQPVMLFLAPLFFVMLGMQVNLLEMVPTVALTIVLILVATGGKIIGCYIPARFVGRLSHTSGMIVGVGMVPRGEVGLIIAGAGLLAGAVSRDLFGAAVAVSIVTTLITPGLLRGIFRREDREKPRTPSS